MHDNLTIDYEVFEEEGAKVLTVGRGDEALWQFHNDEAKAVYNFLINRPSNRDKFVVFAELLSGPAKTYMKKDWRMNDHE